jgi:hypothetical protein
MIPHPIHICSPPVRPSSHFFSHNHRRRRISASPHLLLDAGAGEALQAAARRLPTDRRGHAGRPAGGGAPQANASTRDVLQAARGGYMQADAGTRDAGHLSSRHLLTRLRPPVGLRSAPPNLTRRRHLHDTLAPDALAPSGTPAPVTLAPSGTAVTGLFAGTGKPDTREYPPGAGTGMIFLPAGTFAGG